MGFSPNLFEKKKKDLDEPRVDLGGCPDFNGTWEGFCKGTAQYESALKIDYLYCIEFAVNGHVFFLDNPNIMHYQVPGKWGSTETHNDFFNWDLKAGLHADFNTDQYNKDGDRFHFATKAKFYKEKGMLFFEYKGRLDEVVNKKRKIEVSDVICQYEKQS